MSESENVSIYQSFEHGPDCWSRKDLWPRIRRLYMRQSHWSKAKGRGRKKVNLRQAFVPWGWTCRDCGVVVQEYFKDEIAVPTPEQIKAAEEWLRERERKASIQTESKASEK